ncbi:hypothetical protein A3N68_12925 [Enterobacter asburiae]|uniref:tail fiber assembly protein n=1 Tax=Enterobacter asburiae TaxID=61645 RepID=UPI0007B36247|nr:tail fiber assembly protein [Enterobacter asburiae]ELY2957904.1 tail fiber assembly protein [Cronobacter sakazakii]KZR47718.1 hypothetical protein A3N68_12925 [Enterobacter asburiae]
MYFFSAKTLLFYPENMIVEYKASGVWPTDAIKVSEDIYKEFLNPPTGKVRSARKDGTPCWMDIPPPTQEEFVSLAEQKKNRLFSEANTIIAPLQDAQDLDMAMDNEKDLLLAWKQYRVLLNRVDTSTAPDIVWPTIPAQKAI